MAMKTKSAIRKANKKKVKRAKPSKVRSWTKEEMKKMEEIITSAPDPVIGQKLAADYFDATYASIQCRWSRYKRGMGMGRANKKGGKKTIKQSKVYELPTKVALPSNAYGTEENLANILKLITIKSIEVKSSVRQVVIHY